MSKPVYGIPQNVWDVMMDYEKDSARSGNISTIVNFGGQAPYSNSSSSSSSSGSSGSGGVGHSQWNEWNYEGSPYNDSRYTSYNPPPGYGVAQPQINIEDILAKLTSQWESQLAQLQNQFQRVLDDYKNKMNYNASLLSGKNNVYSNPFTYTPYKGGEGAHIKENPMSGAVSRYLSQNNLVQDMWKDKSQ